MACNYTYTCAVESEDDEDSDDSSIQSCSPQLITLLRSSNWPRALERLRTHPQETSWIGRDGETPLHAAFVDCTKHVPLPILVGITSASGDMNIVSKKMGESTVLDSILLSWCDLIRTGETVPAYEYRLRFQVIYKLISLDEKVIGNKTLDYLFHFTRLWVDLCGGSSSVNENMRHVRGSSSVGNQLGFLFAVMDLILYVHQYGHMRSLGDRPFRNFVNRLIDTREQHEYPLLILHLALERFGTVNCTEHDDEGRTPLIRTILSNQFANNVEAAVALIKNILRQAPGNASLPCRNDRFPLHLAIERGRQWDTGLAPIVFDSPQVLCQIDTVTGLYPFMQSAVRGAELNTVFKLLLMNPLAASGLQGKDGQE